MGRRPRQERTVARFRREARTKRVSNPDSHARTTRRDRHRRQHSTHASAPVLDAQGRARLRHPHRPRRGHGVAGEVKRAHDIHGAQTILGRLRRRDEHSSTPTSSRPAVPGGGRPHPRRGRAQRPGLAARGVDSSARDNARHTRSTPPAATTHNNNNNTNHTNATYKDNANKWSTVNTTEAIRRSLADEHGDEDAAAARSIVDEAARRHKAAGHSGPTSLRPTPTAAPATTQVRKDSGGSRGEGSATSLKPKTLPRVSGNHDDQHQEIVIALINLSPAPTGYCGTLCSEASESPGHVLMAR